MVEEKAVSRSRRLVGNYVHKFVNRGSGGSRAIKCKKAPEAVGDAIVIITNSGGF